MQIVCANEHVVCHTVEVWLSGAQFQPSLFAKNNILNDEENTKKKWKPFG